MENLIDKLPRSETFSLFDQIDYVDGAVSSLAVSQRPGCRMTLFAIDEGEGMSSHAAPGDAMAFVGEGTAIITIDGVENEIPAGSAIVMPKGAPHSVLGKTRFKMLLVVVRE